MKIIKWVGRESKQQEKNVSVCKCLIVGTKDEKKETKEKSFGVAA